MSDHLSSSIVSALVDGELLADQLDGVRRHLASCPSCTSSALSESLLKSATARAGQRYSPPSDLQERLLRRVAGETLPPSGSASRTGLQPERRFGYFGWATAFAVLLICAGIFWMQRSVQQARMVLAERAGLITEVSDRHIATLAADSAPQVLSSDRHTVKPWFQGKIPFSFNLPEGLPSDTTLDGADLTYIHNQPAAQLLYSIGRHHVSVFVRERMGSVPAYWPLAEHSGFHVTGFSTDDLEVVAVSDVDPARLADLVSRIEQAQVGTRPSK